MVISDLSGFHIQIALYILLIDKLEMSDNGTKFSSWFIN